MTAFIRLAGYFAIAGGGLKIIAAFIPYEPRSVGLELLYGVIDAGLLVGLIAVYLTASDQVGAAGLAAFIIALLALASILGPEADMFGIDFYFVGGTIFSFSLAALSVQLLRNNLFYGPASLWIASAAVGAALSAAGAKAAFMVAGLLLSAGFIAAGIRLLRYSPTELKQCLRP